MSQMLDNPLGPGDGVATLWTKPIRLKVADPKRFIELCKTRTIMEQWGASKAAWKSLANEYAKIHAPACSDYCLRMAKCSKK